MFSKRLPDRLEPNRLSAAVARARSVGRALLDLTVTNPTLVGIEYPPHLLTSLADPASLAYRPAPFGLRPARQAVASDFTRRGVVVPAGQIVLTASTSEAYSWLFKLLCDPGDGVLVPQPSYPLFEHLTVLDAVLAEPYRLEYDGVWRLDRDSLVRAWTKRTRMILVVSPNNPTGSLLRAEDLAWLERECAERSTALVSDEVFADYPLNPAPDAVDSVLPARRAMGGVPEEGRASLAPILRFVLGGLSKSVGLPQFKVGWIAAAGPESVLRDALPRLELIADTYLSVNTPAQEALPILLREGSAIRSAISARIAANLATLQSTVRRYPACNALRVEGGWSAILRVPAARAEDDLVEELIEREGVLVHPGYFFDFPNEAFLVVSLLPPTDAFAAGIDRVCAVAADA